MVTLALVSLLSAPAEACTSYSPAVTALYPNHWTSEIPRDAGIWVRLGWADLADVQLVDSAGDDVPVTTHQLADMHVLLPVDPLVQGESYALRVLGVDEPDFTVGAYDTAPAQIPVPVRRTLVADEWREITTEGSGCYGGEPTGDWEPVSFLAYSTCTLDLWTLSAMGPGEPPTPALDDGIDWKTNAYWGTDDGWPDAGPGATATVWFGAVDARGGFSGWTSDEVTLPGSQERRQDVIAEMATTTGTPTSWGDSCPTGDWVIGSVERLPDPPAAPADDASRDCGCTASGSGGAVGWWIPVGLLFARRRA